MLDSPRIPVLADPVNAVGAASDVAFQTGIHTEWSNGPAALVIDTDGAIR